MNLELSFLQGRRILMFLVDNQTFCPGCSQTLSLSLNQWSTDGTSDGSLHQIKKGGWYALEGIESSGRLTEGVLHVLGSAQELVPGVLVAMAEGL